MPWGAPTSIFQMTMNFSEGIAGWEEKLYIPASDITAARVAGAAILPYRLNCLPQQCELRYAHISNMNPPRDGTLLDGNYPVDGLWGNIDSTVVGASANAKVNDPDDAVALRYENDAGSWATRWLHGVPDPEVSERVLVTPIATATVGAVPAYSAASTLADWHSRVEAYLSMICVNTVMFRQATSGNNTVRETSPITRIISRGATRHRTGRVFGTKAGKAPIS